MKAPATPSKRRSTHLDLSTPFLSPTANDAPSTSQTTPSWMKNLAQRNRISMLDVNLPHIDHEKLETDQMLHEEFNQLFETKAEIEYLPAEDAHARFVYRDAEKLKRSPGVQQRNFQKRRDGLSGYDFDTLLGTHHHL